MTTVRQSAARSARSRAAPISRISAELILFPLRGREIVTTSCRGASWTVIVSNCSYVSPENAERPQRDFDPQAIATPDPVPSSDCSAFGRLALKFSL